jgi:hypothetical protein
MASLSLDRVAALLDCARISAALKSASYGRPLTFIFGSLNVKGLFGAETITIARP